VNIDGLESVCRARDPQWHYVIDPYTGRGRSEPLGDAWRPTVSKMRAPGAECGPEAKLWAPNIWHRLWARLTGLTAAAKEVR
jgi:hypothetical protein